MENKWTREREGPEHRISPNPWGNPGEEATGAAENLSARGFYLPEGARAFSLTAGASGRGRTPAPFPPFLLQQKFLCSTFTRRRGSVASSAPHPPLSPPRRTTTKEGGWGGRGTSYLSSTRQRMPVGLARKQEKPVHLLLPDASRLSKGAAPRLPPAAAQVEDAVKWSATPLGSPPVGRLSSEVRKKQQGVKTSLRLRARSLSSWGAKLNSRPFSLAHG